MTDVQPFASEAELFLREFARAFEAGGVVFPALLDVESDLVEVSGVSGQTDDYVLTFATDCGVSLRRNTQVRRVADGVVFTVTAPVRLLEDGVFSEATLCKGVR